MASELRRHPWDWQFYPEPIDSNRKGRRIGKNHPYRTAISRGSSPRNPFFIPNRSSPKL